MSFKYGFISADDHVQETPNLWVDRISKSKFGDRIPHLEKRTDGTEQWVIDGNILLNGNVSVTGAFMPDRNKEPKKWVDVPPAAYVPSERLKVMDRAGIDYSVLYPTVAGLAGEVFGQVQDSELEVACVQAYNDWLLEEWASTSDRFIPQCIVPIWPAKIAITEMQRAIGMGHRGIVFPALPMHLRDVPHVSDPDYDPVWSACEELGVPVCLHAGASPQLQYQAYSGLPPTLSSAVDAVTKPVSSVFVISLLSFSRVLLRHPKLRLVMAESAISWGMLYMEWADHQFEHDGLAKEGYDLKPSEMFHRQCFLTTWFDSIAPFVGQIGKDNILWSTNLPLTTSTWPQTQETIERCFVEVSTETREKILFLNAKKLYNL